MTTALDAPTESLDAAEQRFVANIRQHGWFRTSVFADEESPDFSYTTGFWLRTGRPELIMFSMKVEIAHAVFWDLFRDAEANRSHTVGARSTEVFANLPVYLFPVAKRHYADHLGWSRWFYGDDSFPCLQVVWPDASGRFPWEPGFDEKHANAQRDLSERGWEQSLSS